MSVDTSFAAKGRSPDTHTVGRVIIKTIQSLARNEENARSAFYCRHKLSAAYSFCQLSRQKLSPQVALAPLCGVQFLAF
jgi:hypothetical protein